MLSVAPDSPAEPGIAPLRSSRLGLARVLALAASYDVEMPLTDAVHSPGVGATLWIFGLGIGAAVAAHEGSTLVVVANALRLLAYRDRSMG